MIEYTTALWKIEGHHLSTSERNLLAVSYRRAIGQRRYAIRMLTSKFQDEKSLSAIQCIKQYISQIKEEVIYLWADILELIMVDLMPCASTTEEIVFFTKMQGDYNMYISEVSTGYIKSKHAEQSKNHYEAAMNLAEELDPTNPTRLGLALNFSILYYEILGDK